MSLRFKKYMAVFLLLLFLFPTVTETVHQYLHKDEVACTEIGIHHHKTEHHCTICDFVLLISDLPPIQIFTFYTPRISSNHISFYKTPFVFDGFTCDFFLRGPPAVC